VPDKLPQLKAREVIRAFTRDGWEQAGSSRCSWSEESTVTSTLRIEHQIHDFDSWKVVFDRDPASRRKSGVRHYQDSRPVDDPSYVIIDLDFDIEHEAEVFVTAMREVWKSPQAAPALLGSPQARIVKEVESKEF
jgi:hypothetical protein